MRVWSVKDTGKHICAIWPKNIEHYGKELGSGFHATVFNPVLRSDTRCKDCGRLIGNLGDKIVLKRHEWNLHWRANPEIADAHRICEYEIDAASAVDTAVNSIPSGMDYFVQLIARVEGEPEIIYERMGPSLESHCRNMNINWLPSDILLILCNIAEALNILHGKGICHRDVKPSNILMVDPPFNTTSIPTNDMTTTTETQCIFKSTDIKRLPIVIKLSDYVGVRPISEPLTYRGDVKYDNNDKWNDNANGCDSDVVSFGHTAFSVCFGAGKNYNIWADMSDRNRKLMATGQLSECDKEGMYQLIWKKYDPLLWTLLQACVWGESMNIKSHNHNNTECLLGPRCRPSMSHISGQLYILYMKSRQHRQQINRCRLFSIMNPFVVIVVLLTIMYTLVKYL